MTSYGYGTSLNGWPGIPSNATSDTTTVRAQKIALRAAHLAAGTVPGTTRRVTTERQALPLFLAFLADWHHQVMPIDGSALYRGPDGWLYRDARTGAGLSNHASGTAVDVRYDVLKADHQRHMTPAQTVAVHRLLDKYVSATGRRVFGWGGDWTVGTYCDEMHTELAQHWAPGAQGRTTTPADVAEVITRLRIRSDGTIAPPPVVTPPPNPSPVTASEDTVVVITRTEHNNWQYVCTGGRLVGLNGPAAASLKGDAVATVNADEAQWARFVAAFGPPVV